MRSQGGVGSKIELTEAERDLLQLLGGTFPDSKPHTRSGEAHASA